MSSSSNSSNSFSSMSSSSSFWCCSTPYCDGDACQHFTSWNFSGLNDANSDNCNLYAVFDFFYTFQQVEIYKDADKSQLVAIGQRLSFDGSGTIALEERNGSGLTGTVIWDAVGVFYPSSALLSCFELSSTSSASESSESSSSSVDSKSSLSLSSESLSSSSSGCCTYPYCYGNGCVYFSGWTLNGSNKYNTENCKLYVIFEFVAPDKQEIRLYKSSSYATSELVAEGVGLSGIIYFVSRNNSGLSGSVVWDGTPVYYSSSIILSCNLSTSSSLSSSSSTSSFSSSSLSRSSLSSSSSSSSVSSNSSSYSSSSTSSSGSSESSSLDSSSSSSESIGNVSTSSSSSFGGWNKSKPLILGNSAINAMGVVNKLSQTITITSDTYGIGKVFCYFYGPYGYDKSYTIHLDICLCNDDGSPSTILSSQTISGTSITQNGWYSFDVDVSGVKPLNGYLSFVIWQNGGDEDDYILWGYNYVNNSKGTKALYSSDGITWNSQEGVLRSLKLIGNFDAYDLTDFKIVTPPAERESIVGVLEGGTSDGTKLVKGGYQYGSDKVIIENPDLIASFVIDSSGSMGWNDRFSNRTNFVNNIVTQLKQYYPSNVLFDFVKFGAMVANTDSISSGIGMPATININLTDPNKTTFTFITSSANASQGDIYEVNGGLFTVAQTIVNGNVLVCLASGSASPFISGTLTKTYGSGDIVIDYQSFQKASSSDPIVAYGFKGFYLDHTYNISETVIGNTTYPVENTVSDIIAPDPNWQALISGGAISLGLSNSGPMDSYSLDFTALSGMVLRRPISVDALPTAKIVSDTNIGDTIITVDGVSNFSIGDQIDVLDKNLAAMGYTISNVDSFASTVEISVPLGFSIMSWNNNGGIIQKSNLNASTTIREITAKLLVRDSLVTNAMTFFLQTSNGSYIEWDFQPFKDWSVNNIYWLDETAKLPISVFDTNGNPFPDGTKIEFYVGQYPEDSSTPDQVSTENIARNALIGSTQIYLDSVENYAKDEKIDIFNNLGQVQTATIVEVGKDLGGNYIKIDQPLLYNFYVSDNSRVVKSVTTEDINNSSGQVSQTLLLSSALGIIDVTPIVTGKNIDPSYLKPYDPPPVSPSTTYDELNFDRERIRSGINNSPTIDGISALRILAITEDNLKTINEKNTEANRLMRTRSPNILSEQLEMNQGDIASAVPTTTTTTTVLPANVDYEIETPIYLQNGVAEGSMSTFATEFSEKTYKDLPSINGVPISQSNTLLTRSYSIIPSIVITRNDGTITAKQYLNKFNIDFTNPVAIYSNNNSKSVSFWGLYKPAEDDPCKNIFQGYDQFSMPGIYATEEGYKIEYIVTEQNGFVRSGTMRIRIYSNTVADIAETARDGGPFTRQDLDVTLPLKTANVNGVETTIQPLTTIGQWRETVENNPASQLLEDTASEVGVPERDGIIGTVTQQLQSAGFVFGGPNTGKVLESGFQWYVNPLQWTKATQYGVLQDHTIPIVNGKVSFTLPASDISSLLMIQASISFGDKYESIRSDIVAVANPIDVEPVAPLKITAQGGDATYEIGTRVTWMGDNIADNVVVSFAPAETQALPGVSKTDNGWAGGVKLGPHGVVEMDCPSPDAECTICTGQVESISLSVSYLGYTRNVIRKIEWIGAEVVEDESADGQYFFYIPDCGGMWADGESTNTSECNLYDDSGYNELWIEPYYPADGLNRDRIMGYQQLFNQRPNRIYARADQGVMLTQNQTLWKNSITEFTLTGPNINVGPNGLEFEIKSFTSFTYIDSNGKRQGRSLTGVVEWHTEFDPLTGKEKLKFTRPSGNIIEPLSLQLSLESYNYEVIRNGTDSFNIVADVQWKDQFLNDAYHPFPEVIFSAGICKKTNIKTPATESYPATPTDPRNIPEGCLIIGEHPDVSLSSYSAVVSLSRTSIYNHGDGEHTHSCMVDSNGNGTTDSTISLSGASISDHIHTISNYVVSENGEPLHSHTLRSVAIVKLNPLANPNVNIAINGMVVYDPTHVPVWNNGLPPDGSPYPTSFPNGNRMVFSTLYVNSIVVNRELILELSAPNGVYTAKTNSDTDKCFNIGLSAKISQYTIEDYPGHWVVVPESPVPDGTRVIWEISCFKPLVTNNDNILVIRPDAIRQYMNISVKATVYYQDLVGSETVLIKVSSVLQWLPSVSGLVFEPTNDDMYISQAINEIETIGSSQIHDAVVMSSQRLIDYQTIYPQWKSARKLIFLLTDGDENSSQKSIYQAIDNVNFIDGKCKVPLMPLRLGYSYGSDDVILSKYANDTCGNNYYLINVSNDDMDSIIGDILVDEATNINDGYYTNTIDLGAKSLLISISIDNVTMPINSRALFRYRLSSDNIIWGSWSEWYDSSIVKEFELDLKYSARYFQYQVHLYGNENFESPELYSGINSYYYKPQTLTVFFQPIDLDMNTDEYLGSIHITHKATVPLTSTINYGVSQFNSTDPSDYHGVTLPWITPDRHTILLTRYNELFLTADYQKYTAINGRWPDFAQTFVYRVHSSSTISELVQPTEYAMNSKEGSITFYNTQNKDDKFLLCVTLDPVFRVLCNVENYGSEPVSIDHIGILYNISKRIPMDKNGNIIHTPISMRIP